MEGVLRIAIIGDYNFAYHSHNATNQALQHAEKVLDQPINYYWLNERECTENPTSFYESYDGIIIAPGPYQQPFYFNSIIKNLIDKDIPVLGTGECFKILIETYFSGLGFDLNSEKIISENLVNGNQFTGITLDRFSSEFSKIYLNRGVAEYSSSRYSILPQYSEWLTKRFEIGARNQYFDPEILKLKDHNFFLFTMFCPQIVSSIDVPHPIFTYFVKSVRRIADIRESNDNG
jgi:CTP synthase (UTP-ammonia lyase)